MAGSTTANRNRCVQMTKKTTAAGGAATKGGATSKRASAGGSARRPATATNKSSRVGGEAPTTSPRTYKKKGGDDNSECEKELGKKYNEEIIKNSKKKECDNLIKTCPDFQFVSTNPICIQRVVFTTIKKIKKKSVFFTPIEEVIGYVLIDGSIVSKDSSLIGERNDSHDKCL